MLLYSIKSKYFIPSNIFNRQLSLSTNQIDKIAPLPGCSYVFVFIWIHFILILFCLIIILLILENLKILSLARNNIKKIEKLEDIAETLEELWLSYNNIEKLAGLENCTNLKVLYLGNNKINSFDEIERIAHLSSLKDILLVGNPIFLNASSEQQYRYDVIRRLPNLSNWKLDGEMVTKDEINAAMNDSAPTE